jgi:dTMP kinase
MGDGAMGDDGAVTNARFVVLEGGDASGKSTQVAMLVQRLVEHGVEAIATFEPGATPAGALVRELLLHRREEITPTAEALLMAADRAQHVAEVVRPALAAGVCVVSDRFVPSSLVYQGVVRGVGVDTVAELNRVATDGLQPDLVILLDVGDEVAAGRRDGPSDRLEAEGATFHAAVREAYRALARDHDWVVVDGDAPVEDVATLVWQLVEPLTARVSR